VSCSCLGCSVHGECPSCHGTGIVYLAAPDLPLVSYFGEEPSADYREAYCDCPRGEAREKREK